MSLGSSLSLCGGSALGAAPGSLCVAPRAPRVGAAACAGLRRGVVCARLHPRRQARSLRLRRSHAGAGDGAGEEQASAYGLPGLEGLSEDDLPTQGRAVVSPQRGTAVAERDSGSSDLAYLSELLAIQQSGPRDIGFFGTRNMGFLHQQLIEILSYAMVLTENHIYTSGATGTNAAVIRGALRAERPDLLTVVLPQSLERQPSESRELLLKVSNVVAMPQNDGLPLAEASRICNEDILRRVQQVICFAFHDSRLLLDTCDTAKQLRKMVTLFYLD